MRDWALGTAEGDWVSMSVPSDGSYGIAPGVIFKHRVRLHRAQAIERFLLAAQRKQDIGAAQAGDDLRLLARHARIPSQGLVVTFQHFCQLP